ncbi:MAG: hypothetical protein WKF99_01330 [Solirubrobacteraceae bacterium]
MSAVTARNIAIVVGLALVVWLVPGGGTTAGIIEGLLGAAFMALIGLFGARLYSRYRAEIFGLGDQHRAMLYGAVAVILVTLAASSLLLSTGPTTLIWFALVGACVWTLVLVWRHWREYAI